MSKTVIFIIVFFVLAIVFINAWFSRKKDRRTQYLEQLAKFLNSKVETLDEHSNSYKIDFVYKGTEFRFMDMEDVGFQTNSFRGVLTVQTKDDLILNFTEKSRTRIRSEVIGSIADTVLPGGTGGKIHSPKELDDFSIFTNSPKKATELLKGDIVKSLAKFKNLDSRGFPKMSLQIVNGLIKLNFHPGGEVPSLFDLQSNVTKIEQYLDQIIIIANKINQIKEDEKA